MMNRAWFRPPPEQMGTTDPAPDRTAPAVKAPHPLCRKCKAYSPNDRVHPCAAMSFEDPASLCNRTLLQRQRDCGAWWNELNTDERQALLDRYAGQVHHTDTKSSCTQYSFLLFGTRLTLLHHYEMEVL